MSNSSNLVNVYCPNCGSRKKHKIYPGTILQDKLNLLSSYSYEVWIDGHHPIVQCANCRFYYTCPRDSIKTLAAIYATGSVESYFKETEGKLASFRDEAIFLKKLTGGTGKLLEIGCATGLFLQAATEFGFEVWGCEPCFEAATLAKEKFGKRINVNMFRSTDYEVKTFQVVALWDVIEHVDKPTKLIQDSYNLLAPGGWIALSTPNFDSLSRRLLGSRWHFFERWHLVFFDPKTISDLLCQVGFVNIRILPQSKTYSISYFASYLAKWSLRLSQAALALINRVDSRRRVMLTLPSGCMRVYGQKPL
ncbi:class I SAM-dependent methyltransferase [Coleofasciculus sp.]|uniref:class I SAM-dependent methyltransferase n=1 Tax=Coleofasciculus sp. TaxID=3100458 RepID=UPI0039F9A51D